MRTLLILTILLLPGCCWGNLHESYVAADRANYDVLTPRLETWIEEHPWAEEAQDRDPTLTDEEAAEAGKAKQEDFKGKLQSWGARVKKAETSIAEQTNEDDE